MKNAELIDIASPEARVVFDKPRTLRLNYRALRHAKKALKELRGDDAVILDYEVLDGGLEPTIALVWGALQHEDPELTVEQVEEWLHPGNVAQLRAVMNRMLTEAMPEKDEEGADPLGSEAAA